MYSEDLSLSESISKRTENCSSAKDDNISMVNVFGVAACAAIAIEGLGYNNKVQESKKRLKIRFDYLSKIKHVLKKYSLIS